MLKQLKMQTKWKKMLLGSTFSERKINVHRDKLVMLNYRCMLRTQTEKGFGEKRRLQLRSTSKQSSSVISTEIPNAKTPSNFKYCTKKGFSFSSYFTPQVGPHLA